MSEGASESSARAGVWIARIVAILFLLGGLRYVVGWLFWPALWFYGLVGALMIWIGGGVWMRRDSARKGAIAVAVLHLVSVGATFWTLSQRPHGQAPTAWLAGVAALMIAVCVVLLLPITRDAFVQTGFGKVDDEEPMLTSGPQL